jgi:N-acetylmuramoyl-L-alanine amidase
MKEYFEGCGAQVILTRNSNDVNISNIERAQIATDSKADYFIRLHADSAPDEEISGVKVYVPSSGKYSSSAAADGKKLADAVADSIGSTSLGCVQSNMYTGLNHADSIKSYQIVVGYLSNSADDALLGDAETPYNTAVAVAEFIGG